MSLVVPGEPDVPVRLHRPDGATGPLPCVVGMGSDERLAEWCAEIPLVGLAVGHRSTPYPDPLMDGYAALKWIHAHAAEHGVDPRRIGVHGGGLAAGLALVARDHREVPLAFQILEHPVLDDRSGTDDPRWQAYLGELHGAGDVPIYAAPARCDDLRWLPPTFVAAAPPDDGADYATRLQQTGIPTELGSADETTRWLRRQIGQ